MTIADTLKEYLENKEYEKFYELYEHIRNMSMFYTDSKDAIIEVLLPRESLSK